MTEEELSHCIVSTIEYYEYKVLQELIGAKVRHIIPPVEAADTFNAGLVSGADSLSREYIENPIICDYVNNPHCTIILFENPPYAETTSAEHQKKKAGKASSGWKNSFAVSEMKTEIKGTASNDLGNAFIWSAFKYYLRQPTDSYIVYSPVKYWKAQHLINKKFISGFAFNRRHFHTNIDACIMAALWSNETADIDEFSLDAFDLDINAGELIPCGSLEVKKIHSMFSQKFYDKRTFVEDTTDGIVSEGKGLEAPDTVKVRIKPIYNSNIIGYLVAQSSGFDNPDLNSSLTRMPKYNGNGFYLRTDNYLEKLPMFCASRYITYNREWTERARIMKSADGAEKFFRDITNGRLSQFLLKCLLFTCTEMHNHIRTLKGSDGRFYKNELCLDGTNGETIAMYDLSRLQPNNLEKQILKQWGVLLSYAKKTPEYNPSLTYGVYQIFDEIDISYKDNMTGKTIYKNLEVHSALTALKILVKEYYINEIVPVLFEYEFLK